MSWLLLLLACGSGPTDPDLPAAIEITEPLDQAGSLSASALITQLEGTHFPAKARRSPANAKLFLALAARDTAAHELVAAALEGMAETAPTDRRNQATDPGEDYARVVRTYLGHSAPLLQSRALMAAEPLLARRDDATLAATIALAEHSDAHCYAVVGALSEVGDWAEDEAIVAVYVDALDAGPACASRALFFLQATPKALARRDEVLAKVRGLRTHDDPGVRGRALIVWATLEADKSEVATELAPYLDDDSAFVRSAAARAAGIAKAAPLVPTLLALTEDDTANTYDLTGWTDLEGTEGRVHHEGSPHARVDDAAVRAIAAISGVNGTPRLRLSRVRHSETDADLARNVDEATAWVEAHGDALSAE